MPLGREAMMGRGNKAGSSRRRREEMDKKLEVQDNNPPSYIQLS